jgi:dTDP-4-dehydrorhamnose reductase
MGGGEKKDKKFIQKLIKQIKTGNTDLYIVNDKDGTPTYTLDFAKNVKLLIEKELWGLYNMVCGGQTSRMEVAKELLKILNLKTNINLIEVNSDFFQKEYFAERPPSERLINKKLDLRSMNTMRDWRIALKEYIQNSYTEMLEG